MNKLSFFTTAILLIFLNSCKEKASLSNTANYLRAIDLMKQEKYHEFEDLSSLIISSSLDPVELAHINYLHGYVMFQKDSLEQAYYSLKQAGQYFKILNDDLNTARVCNWLGHVFYKSDLFNHALRYYQTYLDYSQKLDEDIHIANALHGIGKAYKRLGNYEESLKHLFEVRKLEKEMQRLVNFIDIQLEIGIVHHLAGNQELALKYNWQVINSATGTDHENLFKGKAYNNIGDIFYEERDYLKAEKFLNQSLEYTDRGDTHLAATYNNLGKVYNKLGRYKKSAECFMRSVELNHTKVDMEEITSAFQNICHLPGIKTNADSLLHYMTEFARITAPILTMRNRLETNDIRQRLEGQELALKVEQNYLTTPTVLWISIIFIAIILALIVRHINEKYRLSKRSKGMRELEAYMKIKSKENADWIKKIKKDRDMFMP